MLRYTTQCAVVLENIYIHLKTNVPIHDDLSDQPVLLRTVVPADISLLREKLNEYRSNLMKYDSAKDVKPVSFPNLYIEFDFHQIDCVTNNSDKIFTIKDFSIICCKVQKRKHMEQANDTEHKYIPLTQLKMIKEKL